MRPVLDRAHASVSGRARPEALQHLRLGTMPGCLSSQFETDWPARMPDVGFAGQGLAMP